MFKLVINLSYFQINASMAKVELIMPKMGESIIEATILNWVKGVGDYVEADETILEIATDKVDSEVPSPVSGTISEILFVLYFIFVFHFSFSILGRQQIKTIC